MTEAQAEWLACTNRGPLRAFLRGKTTARKRIRFGCGCCRLLPGTFAARATAPGETIHHEPFEVRADMVADAILAADAPGTAWKKHSGETAGPAVPPAQGSDPL